MQPKSSQKRTKFLIASPAYLNIKLPIFLVKLANFTQFFGWKKGAIMKNLASLSPYRTACVLCLIFFRHLNPLYTSLPSSCYFIRPCSSLLFYNFIIWHYISSIHSVLDVCFVKHMPSALYYVHGCCSWYVGQSQIHRWAFIFSDIVHFIPHIIWQNGIINSFHANVHCRAQVLVFQIFPQTFHCHI